LSRQKKNHLPGIDGSRLYPSYLGSRDQEHHGSKPAWPHSSQDPSSKKVPSHKRAGEVAQGVGPEFKPQFGKKKKSLNSMTGQRKSLNLRNRKKSDERQKLAEPRRPAGDYQVNRHLHDRFLLGKRDIERSQVII
jgi:hypothetical protein